MDSQELKRRQDDKWHLVKGIPVAVLIVLVLQTASAIWYFATLASTVSAQGTQIGELRTDIKDLVRALSNVVTPLAINTTEIQTLKARVDAMASRVEALQVESIRRERTRQ